MSDPSSHDRWAQAAKIPVPPPPAPDEHLIGEMEKPRMKAASVVAVIQQTARTVASDIYGGWVNVWDVTKQTSDVWLPLLALAAFLWLVLS